MSIFGSVARGDSLDDSDVDIIVSMPPKIFMLSALIYFLEKILNNSVDLIRRHPHMSEKFLKEISRDEIAIF